MMKLLGMITKRPKDSTIWMSLTAFWVLLIAALSYNLLFQGDTLETSFFWIELDDQVVQILKYVFVAVGLLPLYLWLTRQCLLKKKHMRILQAAFWVILFYMSSKVTETGKLDVDELLFILAFFPILAGATGKMIASTCMRYKEKINKIRV